ncbi:MAG: hypothetical protein FWG61_01975, partial [Firmicutes bacterium]|nr:hypothetical protein [Bacillota bacterium]
HGVYIPPPPSCFLTELPAAAVNKSSYTPPRQRQKAHMSQYTNNVFAPHPKPAITAPSDSNHLIKLGDKVRHSMFGDGVVVKLSGSGEDLELTVAFPGQGIKQFLWRYTPIQKI